MQHIASNLLPIACKTKRVKLFRFASQRLVIIGESKSQLSERLKLGVHLYWTYQQPYQVLLWIFFSKPLKENDKMFREAKLVIESSSTRWNFYLNKMSNIYRQVKKFDYPESTSFLYKWFIFVLEATGCDLAAFTTCQYILRNILYVDHLKIVWQLSGDILELFQYINYYKTVTQKVIHYSGWSFHESMTKLYWQLWLSDHNSNLFLTN